MQGWILEQKRDIHGKTSEMQAVSSLVNNNISVLGSSVVTPTPLDCGCQE